MHILVLHQVNAKKLSIPGTPGLWKFMKWTADAAVLQNVDFSSQFVKWIRDGTALCQTKVATDLPLCWCCCLLVGLLLLFFVVAGWMLGATRGTQLTYSQIRSVWGTICMRRSCKSGSKSEQEELELSFGEYRTKKDLWLAVIYCCPLTRTWGHRSEKREKDELWILKRSENEKNWLDLLPPPTRLPRLPSTLAEQR